MILVRSNDTTHLGFVDKSKILSNQPFSLQLFAKLYFMSRLSIIIAECLYNQQNKYKMSHIMKISHILS